MEGDGTLIAGLVRPPSDGPATLYGVTGRDPWPGQAGTGDGRGGRSAGWLTGGIVCCGGSRCGVVVGGVVAGAVVAWACLVPVPFSRDGEASSC